MRLVPITSAVACLLAFSLCLPCATASAAGEPDWHGWAIEARKQHPLAGTMYQPDGAPFLRWWPPSRGTPDLAGGRRLRHGGPGILSEPNRPAGPALVRRSLLLLGEVHDNPIHHRLRAWMIRSIASRPRRSPSWHPVVFEQISSDQQPALDRFEALKEAGKGTADKLLRLLDWDKSGWPPASSYRPLFKAVVAARLPILAGDVPRARIKAVARRGLKALTPAERARLGPSLDSPLPAPLAKALDRELIDSHCGALPPGAVSGMAAAQRFRDAHLADVLLAAGQRHGSAILIAGNGHVRSDRGVPWHIRRRKPGARVLSVLLVEVEAEKTDPAAYVPRDPDGKPAADLVIFTPRAEREDPCLGIKFKGSGFRK